MTFALGEHDFAHVTYDEEMDVLYLRKGAPATGRTHATSEGHAVTVDGRGVVVGVTVVNARWLVERDGEIVITVPDRSITLSAQDVGAALEGALRT